MGLQGRNGQNVGLVHDALRAAILRGDISPGQITSQSELMRDLGVSRTPLREALRLLEHEGLILAEPNRRIRVADFSIADVEALYAMRIALEAVAIRVSVPTLQPEDLAELEGLMTQMDHFMRLDELERMEVPHRTFHAKFVAAAGERVASTIGQLFDHAQRYRTAYGASVPEGWPTRRAEHRAMLDAAAAGDADLTVERMAIHYLRTAMRTISELDPEHDPVLLRTTVASVAPAALGAIRVLSASARTR
jgi:DNA-binding GntR family transcriptional regulator